MDVKKLPFVIEDRQRALSPRCTGVGRKRRASNEEIRLNPVLVSWTPKASRLASTMKPRWTQQIAIRVRGSARTPS